jgi:hypothetical protein
MAIPIFTWFGIGYSQFGYAFALTFYPFLYLILILSLLDKTLTKNIKWIIFLGTLFNVYLLYNQGFFELVGLY